MRIRKILKLICPVLALLLLTGCGNIKDIFSGTTEKISSIVEKNIDSDGYQSPHEYAVSKFNEVLELVQAKDSQAIFDLFSEYDRNNIELMPDIEKLVTFLDGKIVEMRHVGASNDYSSVRDGVTVSAGYSAETYVTTNNGTLYWFRVGVITADEDKTKLGLDWIYILDCDTKTAHTDAWVEWRTNNFDDKEAEPPIPDNMEIGVNYFKSN